MRTILTALLILWLGSPASGVAQITQLNTGELENGLKNHIRMLASDQFEGRETGTKGEQMTIDYIGAQFKSIGLEPKGTDGYVQRFSFVDGVKQDAKTNSIRLDNAPLELSKEFYALPYSSNGKVSAEPIYVGYGITAPALGYDDYKDKTGLKGKILVMTVASPDAKKETDSYKDVDDFRSKIDLAISKGAAAVIFINPDSASDDPVFKHSEIAKISASTIPVVFVASSKARLLRDGKVKNVMIEVNLVKTERSGQNIMGYIDNKAAYTIIIGAHLDHLGYGDEESSLYKGERAIHNGADDNASGTAAVIEMAKFLKKYGSKNSNYLLMGFSGEEKGLIGSSYYSKNPTIDLKKVNYMINMDMIGRMKNEERTLAIYGTGTSPVWNRVLPLVSVDSIKAKTTESGVGPSDHTSFYLKDIPVLHFFTGFHPDYHKPGDDEAKINYKGEVSVIRYILTIMELVEKEGKLAFTRTKEEPVASKNTSKPKVTLGVIPDYMYSTGDGMKIDGVTDGKPASIAGLRAGDLILQIGENKVVDMQSYMKALSHFNKGDQTTVRFKRDKETMTAEIKFESEKKGLSEANYRIYSVASGKEVTLDSVIRDMKNYDVIFYGEEHNDSVTHFLEKTIFQKMSDAYPANVALSMEMFERDVQTVMDEYLMGSIRERNFLKDARVWSNYRDYKPMIELAKEKKIDVVCANAPGRYTNLAGRKGQAALKDLPAGSRAFFAPLPYDTAQGKYYEKLQEMSGHSAAPSTDTSKTKAPAMSMGNFNLIVAQSLWDATMAYSISEYRKKQPAKKVFQVNGRFHSDEGFAVVTQLRKYSPKTRIMIISSGPDQSFPQVNWEPLKKNGNYIIVTDPSIPRTFEQ